MGGRVAEELTQDDITTGAGNDIERATELARKMVREWGMSDLGPVSLGGNGEPVFLGRDYTERSDYSDDTARRIDAEVERLVETATRRRPTSSPSIATLLDQLARDLLERESLDGAEVYDLIEEMTGHRSAHDQRDAGVTRTPEAEETIAASEASRRRSPSPRARDRAPSSAEHLISRGTAARAPCGSASRCHRSPLPAGVQSELEAAASSPDPHEGTGERAQGDAHDRRPAPLGAHLPRSRQLLSVGAHWSWACST